MTQNFVIKIKEKLEKKFQENQTKVTFVLFERQEKELQLNNHTDYNAMINENLKKEYKDLILVFRPTVYGLNNTGGGLNYVNYEITGIDTKTQKEVWKSKFMSQSGFGPAFVAEDTANSIIKKLKSDKII